MLPRASCESPGGSSVAPLFGRRLGGIGLLASVAAQSRFRLDGERIRRDLSVVTLVGGFCHTSLLLRIRSTSSSLLPSEERPAACSTCRSSYIPVVPPASPSPFKAHRTARGTSALGLRAAPRRAAISRNARISLADLNADKKGSQPGHLQYPRSMPSVKVKSVKSE